MTITNGYCTLAEFKARFYPAGLTDTTDDTVIENVIEAVSRQIDNYAGRRFYVTGSDETRYFTAEESEYLSAGDVVSITTLSTDENDDRVYERTWAATDYDLTPYNAALDGLPYTRLEITPNGSYAFPTGAKSVKIVGKWGYPATPDAINEACLIQAIRLFKRKDAPFGVMGSAEMGQLVVIPRLDPDVKMLLDPFRKFDVVGI
jgi:hypothetical protein